MIEESQECHKIKKSTKLKKKSSQKLIEEELDNSNKILEEGKQISEMSEPDQKEERKKAAENLYELLQDLIACLLLDHDQCHEEIQTLLTKLKDFNLTKINHKQIQAYSFWAQIVFIEKKLLESQIQFDIRIVEKKKEKLLQIFKRGLRQFENLKQINRETQPVF